MKLSSSSEVLAENKVIILYVLDQIGRPITDSVFLKVITSVTDLNYFYFQQFLLDLIGSNYIIKYEKNNNIFYELTTDGKRVLDLTLTIIPGIVKLKIDTNLKPCIKEIADELSIVADFTPNDNNSFFVDCKIVEKDDTVFQIGILAGSREQAKIIVDNWKQNAAKYYPNILQMILNPKQQNNNKKN